MGPESQSSDRIRSAFWEDEDMRELIDLFVAELGTRIEDLSIAWQRQHTDQIRVVAHQLSGVSAGYGFSSIGEAAQQLEHALIGVAPDADLACVQSQFSELLDLCQRAIAGMPQE